MSNQKQLNKAAEYVQQAFTKTNYKEKLKLFNKAIKLYEHMLSQNKNSASINNSLANTYRHKADYLPEIQQLYTQAITHYETAIENSETDAIYWSNLSASYAKLGEYNKAIETGKTAIEKLKMEENQGIAHGNQVKILDLEIKLYQEYQYYL